MKEIRAFDDLETIEALTYVQSSNHRWVLENKGRVWPNMTTLYFLLAVSRFHAIAMEFIALEALEAA